MPSILLIAWSLMLLPTELIAAGPVVSMPVAGVQVRSWRLSGSKEEIGGHLRKLVDQCDLSPNLDALIAVCWQGARMFTLTGTNELWWHETTQQTNEVAPWPWHWPVRLVQYAQLLDGQYWLAEWSGTTASLQLQISQRLRAASRNEMNFSMATAGLWRWKEQSRRYSLLQRDLMGRQMLLLIAHD